jgi:hypothetical protein
MKLQVNTGRKHMTTEVIKQNLAVSQLKHAAIGIFVGVAFTLFCCFLYVEDLKLQVVDDIQYERDFIINAYKPALEMLTLEERIEWVSGLPDRERNVMCTYLSSMCDQKNVNQPN